MSTGLSYVLVNVIKCKNHEQWVKFVWVLQNDIAEKRIQVPVANILYLC